MTLEHLVIDWIERLAGGVDGKRQGDLKRLTEHWLHDDAAIALKNVAIDAINGYLAGSL